MLTVRDKMALDLAGQRYAYEAMREKHALELLDYNPTRFWAVVNRLIDNPDALAYAPTTVRRLRRLREKRQAARSLGFRAAG